MRPATATLLALLSLCDSTARSAPQPADDPAMIALASRSGCLTCHAVRGPSSPDQTGKPIGPAWRDVAIKYKGQHGAAKKLVQTVMNGSSPYASHWNGKVSGLAMPPNQVAISPRDARRLVNWILSLE